MMKKYRLTRRPFVGDRRILVLLMLAGIALGVRGWLAENPQHNPWAPLDLRDPPGWATAGKLTGLRDEPDACRAVLERSGVSFSALPSAGEGACLRSDRTVLADFPLRPSSPPTSCAIAAGMALWFDQKVQPAARDILGSSVVGIEHYGAFNCRRINNAPTGRWSEHATGNAIDIAAFVLDDGRRISVLGDWEGDDTSVAFLKEVRDGACEAFGTVLSPDYNAAHRDHFHFDQQSRGYGSLCR